MLLAAHKAQDILVTLVVSTAEPAMWSDNSCWPQQLQFGCTDGVTLVSEKDYFPPVIFLSVIPLKAEGLALAGYGIAVQRT